MQCQHLPRWQFISPPATGRPCHTWSGNRQARLSRTLRASTAQPPGPSRHPHHCFVNSAKEKHQQTPRPFLGAVWIRLCSVRGFSLLDPRPGSSMSLAEPPPSSVGGASSPLGFSSIWAVNPHRKMPSWRLCGQLPQYPEVARPRAQREMPLWNSPGRVTARHSHGQFKLASQRSTLILHMQACQWPLRLLPVSRCRWYWIAA